METSLAKQQQHYAIPEETNSNSKKLNINNALLLPSPAAFHNHHHHHSAVVGAIPIRGRIYPSFPTENTAAIANIAPAATDSSNARWVTREIAALDFLLGIPLERESSIVRAGLNARLQEDERETIKASSSSQRHHPHEKHHTTGTSTPSADLTTSNNLHWWEKIISSNQINSADKARRERLELEEKELEQPSAVRDHSGGEDHATFSSTTTATTLAPAVALCESASPSRTASASVEDNNNNNASNQIKSLAAVETYLVAQHVAPGRRLDGREASFLRPPKVVCTMDKLYLGRSIAATSALREWEVRLAHGIGSGSEDAKGLLDGRAFFSSQQGYPLAVFSLVRYEPKKEEAARRRRKVEELGGGGTQFVIPERDWRGVSYAALMKKHHSQKHRPKISDQSSGDSLSDDETCSLSSSDESDTYEPGFLDDPAMVQGRHRQVMVGNRITGPIISSVIQFVDPADLKADLNKQFLARFDGWEPPKCQRRYIGGHVVNGVYTLTDPTESNSSGDKSHYGGDDNDQVHKVNSDIDTIRMPPSLTLSKIRSLKQQVLLIGLKADLEISTIALACVYFERLCLDCRVDKSNRQLTFAACLLLAYKTNEPNVAIIHTKPKETKKGMQQILHTFIQPARKSIGVFSSLLDYLTNHFSLSLKHLFAAEWGVFVALGFKLHVKPSQVAFHFKRFMKVLERNALHYLGEEMYKSWQDCLLEEAMRKDLQEERRRSQQEKAERKLMKLQRQLQLRQKQEASSRRRSSVGTIISTSGGTGASSNRGSNDDMVMGDEHTNRRVSSLGGYEDDYSHLEIPLSSVSAGEPSPKRVASERAANKLNLKAWAGNVIRSASSKRPPSGPKDTEGPALDSPAQWMRKSVSSPHLKPDHALSPEGSRMKVLPPRRSLVTYGEIAGDTESV